MAADTMVMLDLLEEAGDEAVTLDELGVAGVRDPAQALLELELAGPGDPARARARRARRARRSSASASRGTARRRRAGAAHRRARRRRAAAARASAASCMPCAASCCALVALLAAAKLTPRPATLRRASCRTSTRCARRCARVTRRRCAHRRADDAFLHALRALPHRAARPAARRLRRRRAPPGGVGRAARCDRVAPPRARARGAAPRSTTSARSPRTGCSASRPWATSPTSTASPARSQGVRERLPYLRELGVTYLHLMPLLRTRPEPNDGGYAVTDYGEVEPALGTMADLRELAAELRASGIALCVDVVLNHTAREHPWARRRAAGDARRLAFYRTFPDRTEPDAYERTLPEVFPDTAPGNFTWDQELERWVWTTFNAYQWDLDHANPEVFVAMARPCSASPRSASTSCASTPCRSCGSASAPNCQNQPEVHDLLQAYRAAVADRRARGGVQGGGDRRAPRSRRLPRARPPRGHGVRPRVPQRPHGAAVEHARVPARRAPHAHARRRCRRCPPGAGWLTYVRCHDDIGWAITDEDARAVGEDAAAAPPLPHRFYTGDFPGSFARGARFQPEPERRVAHQRHGGVPRRPGGRARARRRAGRGARAAPAARAVRRRVRARRAAAHLHGRRARAAQRPTAGPRDPAHARRQPLDAPSADGLGARPARRTSGARRREACGRGSGGSSSARRAIRALNGHRRLTPGLDGGRPRLRPAARARRATGCCSSPASASSGGRCRSRCSTSTASSSMPRAAEPDGRPLRIDGSTLILEPYQHVWCEGPLAFQPV